jgi:uncharacterized membrane protein YdjX (TVP38/TMEM64 family)
VENPSKYGPEARLGRFGSRGTLTALLGTGLLVADVVLPRPSSVVMVAHGALFSVVGGTLLLHSATFSE